VNENPTHEPELTPAATGHCRRRWLVAAAIVLVVAAGVWAARPAYHKFRLWRARQLAAQAEQLLAQNLWTQANGKAQAALLLNRADPAVLRASARVLTQATNSGALLFWRKLIIARQATPRDRRDYVTLAIRTGAVSAAAEELQHLLKDETNQPTDLWLASQLYAGLGDQPHALHYAARAEAGDPQNQQYRLFLSSLLYNAHDADQQARARSNLWAMARAQTAPGLEALGFLAAQPDLNDGQMRELLDALKAHPEAGLAQQWQMLGLQLRLEPARRAHILDAAAAQYQSAAPEVRRQFGLWLNQQGEYERTLAALPQADALQRNDLFLVFLDALASLNRWEALQTLLTRERVPLEDVHREAFLARCSLQLGNPDGTAAHWQQALAAAERNIPQLVWLADYTARCGAVAEAQRAWRAIIRCANDPRPAYASLEQLIEQTGSTAALRDLVGEMRQRWPDDPAIRNDFAYLNALLSEAVPESRRAAEELVKQFPESLTHRTTLALACYRQGDFAAALQAFDGPGKVWQQAAASQRAIYAAVLAANGKTAEAREQLRYIPRDELRPEERALLPSLEGR
jgi:hypothetical protein